jgi:hypothetical protein
MTASLKLYEATDALDVVREWIYEHDEEIRAMEGALPDELAELLAKAEGDFKAKAERVALFIRELLANAAAVKIEEERLTARRKHYERAADGLKRYLQGQMELAGIPKVEGKLCTLRLQKSPPGVIGNPTLDSLAYWKTTLTWSRFVVTVPEQLRLDGRALIEAWKSGEEIPVGVEVVQGQHLRIV